MVTSINLGGISQQDGRNVVLGTGSGGLDTAGLIDSLTEARRLPAVQLETRIEENAAEVGAFGELRTILTNFQNAADILRNAPGINNADENVFNFATADLTSSTGADASAFVGVTVEPGTLNTTYDLTVDQIATRNVQTTDTFNLVGGVAAPAVGAGLPFVAGDLILGANGTTVTLEDGDTLGEVIANINAQSDLSGVEASLITVSPDNFRISLVTTDTGVAANYTIGGTALNTPLAVQQNAVDAELTLNGTQISRSDNVINDVVDGLTFDLRQVTPVGADLSLEVEADTDLVLSAITSFVDAYNEFRIFTARQNEVGEDGTPSDAALLSGNSALRSITSRVATEITGVVEGITGSDPSQLSEIGLEFFDFEGDDETPLVRNVLQIDQAALSSALQNDFDSVRAVFEFDFETTNPALTVFSRTNALDASNVTLNIDQTNGIFTADVDGVTIDLDVESLATGVLLRGQAGTALEGLELIFGSNADDVIDLTLTQGIADRLFNDLEDVLDIDDGIIQQQVDDLTGSTERFQEQIANIDSAIEIFRDSLLRQFSVLEQAISTANLLLQQLSAQNDARIANS